MLTAVRPESPHGLAVLRRTVAVTVLGTGLVVLVVPTLVPQTESSRIAHSAIAVSLLAVGAVLGMTRRSERAGIQALVLATLGVVGVLVWLSAPLTVEPWLVLPGVALLATFGRVEAAVTGLVIAVLALGAGAVLASPTDPPLAAVAGAGAGAGLVAVVAWTWARATGPRGRHDAAAALVDAAELHERLDALAEHAIAGGPTVAVVLVASAEQGTDRHALAGRIAARSREDDVVAELAGSVAVVLPGARAAEATVYAARVLTTIPSGPADDVATGAESPTVAGTPDALPAAAGVATIRDAADSAEVLLRRAGRALQSAVGAGAGTIGVEGEDGVALHFAEDVAAVPGAGGRLD